MEPRMFDEIMVGLAALEAEIAAINARPLPATDLKYAKAQLKAKPVRVRKRLGKAKTPKPHA
ncbi:MULTISPECIES: hypothetical protein [unclassified Rhizobium]|uniref:hypothetical protein n=1 Tax=Rhizobium sp. GCM10022189 TaxID=3252654 RepID=UPI000DD97E1A